MLSLLEKISSILNSSNAFDYLIVKLHQTFHQELGASKLALVLVEDDKAHPLTIGFEKSTKDWDKVAKAASKKEILVAKRNKSKNILSKLGIEALIPLWEGKKKIGLLALNSKESGEAYNEQELKLFEVIAPQLILAIKNIRSQEEIVKLERERIHQDVHDKIYNRLAALAKQAELASFELALQKNTLKEIDNSIRDTISDLHEIVVGAEERFKNSSEPQELIKICGSMS